MEKPQYDHDALKQGLEAIAHNIKTLQGGIVTAEGQKKNAEQAIRRANDQQRALRVELREQTDRQAEFCRHVKQHEKWKKTRKVCRKLMQRE